MSAVPTDLEVSTVLQDEEVPGLAPVQSPRTDTGPPFDLPEEGDELLQRSGYISTTYQPAEGNRRRRQQRPALRDRGRRA